MCFFGHLTGSCVPIPRRCGFGHLASIPDAIDMRSARILRWAFLFFFSPGRGRVALLFHSQNRACNPQGVLRPKGCWQNHGCKKHDFSSRPLPSGKNAGRGEAGQRTGACSSIVGNTPTGAFQRVNVGNGPKATAELTNECQLNPFETRKPTVRSHPQIYQSAMRLSAYPFTGTTS